MTKESASIGSDRTPHASPACSSEADQAGSCLSPSKNPLSYPELWQHLLDKGLEAGSYDAESAAVLLRQYGYYRLRGYWITLEESGCFLPGTTLDDIKEIADFDREISRFILDCIFDIEIALREVISYHFAQRFGPYALYSPRPFKNETFYEELQATLSRERKQGLRYKLPFVAHFTAKGGRLPVWAQVCLASFGTLSKIYRNIDDPELARSISKQFDVRVPMMASWLRYLTQLRNMCAHQDRLYNVMFTIRPALFSEHKSLDSLRLFAVFIVVFHMLESIDARKAAAARARLGQIIDMYPNVDLGPVGFPPNWRDYVAGTYGPVASKDGQSMRARRGNAGRKRKNQAAIDEALYLYDTNAGTIAEICERTGVGHSTLYKYINLRKQGTYPRLEYTMVKLETDCELGTEANSLFEKGADEAVGK